MDANSPQIYEFGAFRLDLNERLLTQKGKPVPLTPKAFEVLAYLVERPGHLVEKNELMNEVWSRSIVEEANLSRTIWMLRQALGDDRNGHGIIETVPKHGYRFVAEVRAVDFVEEDGDAKDLETVERPAEAVVVSSEVRELEVAEQTKSSIWRRYRPAFLAVFLAAILIAAFISVYVSRITSDTAAYEKPIRSLAVLSLENPSRNQEEEYFSDTMTEILVTELGKIHDLTVIDRGSTKRYKGTDKSIPEIARELNVDAVATGSAMLSGGQARITVRLYRAETGESIWSDSFQGDSGNVLALQGSIARAIADAIKIKLSAPELTALAGGRSANADAQDTYLRGLFVFSEAKNLNFSPEQTEKMLKSVGLFERAIANDPSFADAHAMLASAFYNIANARPEYWPKAKESALTALRLDDSNARAHYTLAAVAFRYEFDRLSAEKEFKRANDLVPNSGEGGPGSYALFLSSDGRQEEAIAAMKKAMVIAPLSIGEKLNFGNFHIRAGRYDEAIEWLQKVLEIAPKNTLTRLAYAQALACKERFPEAVAETRKAIEISNEPGQSLRLAWIYARAGERAEAVRILDDVMSSSRLGDPARAEYDAAGVYAELGDKDKAFSSLEKAFAGHALPIIWLKVSPEFKNLQGDPRYEAMVRRLGLSP